VRRGVFLGIPRRALPELVRCGLCAGIFRSPPGTARRHPPAVTVNRHGRAETNTEAAEEWAAFFSGEGIDALQPWMTTQTNEELGLILLYAATKTEEGAIEVKFDA
jgi:hypothetical protein